MIRKQPHFFSSQYLDNDWKRPLDETEYQSIDKLGTDLYFNMQVLFPYRTCASNFFKNSYFTWSIDKVVGALHRKFNMESDLSRSSLHVASCCRLFEILTAVSYVGSNITITVLLVHNQLYIGNTFWVDWTNIF